MHRFIAIRLFAVLALRVVRGFSSDGDTKFFREQIQPLLEAKCAKCHSHAAGKMKGGLTLDSRAGWAEGGDSGPAILPPNLLRHITDRAGCHNYLDTPDACYVNATMVGLHAGRTGTARITLPAPQTLTDMFSGRTYAEARVLQIKVKAGETYAFFRGTAP